MKTATNRIPRNAQKIEVTMKIATNASKAGEVLNVWRDDYGWHGTNESGQQFRIFLSMLRNPEVCTIKITA